MDDETTLARIKKTHKDTGEIIDPHSAVGLEAAHQIRSSGSVSPEIPIISLACAHPAKFPTALSNASLHTDMPNKLSAVLNKKEKAQKLSTNDNSIFEYIKTNN